MCVICGSFSCRWIPQRDIPRFIAMDRARLRPVNLLRSSLIALEDVNANFAAHLRPGSIFDWPVALRLRMVGCRNLGRSRYRPVVDRIEGAPNRVAELPDFGGGFPEVAWGAPDRGGWSPDRGGGVPNGSGGAPDFGGWAPDLGGGIVFRARWVARFWGRIARFAGRVARFGGVERPI